jgi:hypothetical protein
MRLLWINTHTGEHVFAEHPMERDSNGVPYSMVPNVTLSVGFRSTYAWENLPGSVGGHAAEVVYALPAPLDDEEPQPLRMGLRNDGYGTSEKHPRMNNSVGSASSNPDNSSRVFGGGESAYR